MSGPARHVLSEKRHPPLEARQKRVGETLRNDTNVDVREDFEFLSFAGRLCGKVGGILQDLSDLQNKGSKLRGNYRLSEHFL